MNEKGGNQINDILKDLPAQALVEAIKGNRFEWYGYLGRSPNAELHDSPNLTWLLTGVPFSLINTVIRTQLPEDKVDEVIEETVAHFKSKNVTSFSWWTEPGTQPANLGTHLIAHGFTYTEGPPGMAIDLLLLQKNLETPHGLTIKRVVDTGALRKWSHTLLISFGLPTTNEDTLFNLFTGLGFDLPLLNYIGFLNGKPVAISELYLGAGVAGIYGVVTIPEERRRGIGTAMTLTPLLEARDMGYRIGILHSSEMGFGVYSRLGFQEYCRMSHYAWTGEMSS
jgi:ribosomal protein S18 acetylase RimI-like enzyme